MMNKSFIPLQLEKRSEILTCQTSCNHKCANKTSAQYYLWKALQLSLPMSLFHSLMWERRGEEKRIAREKSKRKMIICNNNGNASHNFLRKHFQMLPSARHVRIDFSCLYYYVQRTGNVKNIRLGLNSCIFSHLIHQHKVRHSTPGQRCNHHATR